MKRVLEACFGDEIMKKQITISGFEYYRSLLAALAIGCGAGFVIGMLLGVLGKVIG